MAMAAQRDIIQALADNVEASIRAIENNDWVAARALAEQEARIMDQLRAMWSVA
jgi:hypothetical protein